MQQDNTFQAGLQRDSDPQYQPLNSYPEATHFFYTAGGHLQQERAARPLPQRPARAVLGGCHLGTQEILFSGDSAGGEVGVQDGDAYTAVVSTAPLGSYVSCTARVDYQGHRLVYFGDGLQFSWVDLDATPPTVSAVIPDPALPSLQAAAVDSSGELPTGVYQACVCLLTASKNPVSYSPFTGLVPVVDEVTGSTAHELDGAPPQTAASGSIRFTLSQLPAGYAYAQLVVATYTGTGNALQLFRLPLIALGGRASLDYTYYSFSQHQEAVDFNEVLGTLAEYSSASHVLQKDGHLLAAGVGTGPKAAVDWQAIANGVRLAPVTRPLPFQEDSTSGLAYKDALATTSGKGYLRDEVYAFALVPVVNGRPQDAYHIPGQPATLGGVNAAWLQPYYSDELYPLTGGYAADGLGNRNIRHHRMPRQRDYPLLSGASASGATLNVLGVRLAVAPDFSALPAAVQQGLDGYYLAVQARTPGNESVLAQGIAQALVPTDGGRLMVSPFTGKWPAVQNGDGASAGYNGKGDGSYGAFYSAETQLLGAGLPAATVLSPVGLLSGSSQLVASEREGNRPDKYAHLFCHFYNLTALPEPVLESTLVATTQKAVAGADDYAPDLPEGGSTLYAWQQNGYTLLRTRASFYNFLPDFQEDVRYQEIDGTDTILLRQADGSYQNQDQAAHNGLVSGVASRVLYNVKAVRPRQYGPLEGATYYPVAYVPAGSSGPVDAYNGDVFITKVALQSNTAERSDSDHTGLRFRTLNYFFCESTVNAGFRHYLPAQGTAVGTLPYYPKLSLLWSGSGSGVMEYPSGLGHPTGYNRQYSFQNTLTPFFPRDNTLTEVTAFANRVLYSEASVEGEQLDACRIFRANSYHDIPKDKGPITGLWDWSGSLYVHTSQALYKSFFNEASTQTTSEGEVYLGNGGLFPRPSVPVLTLEGGFAGCQHPKASVSSPVGRFFPDEAGQRQYLFNGTLQELSKDGLREFFQQQLTGPLNLVGSYDYQQERFTLYNLPQGAISWSARTQRWCSFHEAGPGYALSGQRRTLLDEQGLGVQNQGPLLPCALSAVTNAPPTESKVFDALQLQAGRVPDAVRHQTRDQGSVLTGTALLTTYGQQALPNETLFRQASDQLQAPVCRDGLTNARLKGKWLQTTTHWAAGAVPLVVRQLTTLFRQSFR